MPKRTWEIVLDGQSHLIQLNHGLLTSKHEVYLDGQLVAHSRHIMDAGSQHTCAIGQHQCEVHIVSNGFQYRYLLLVDDNPHVAREDVSKKPERDKLIQKGIVINEYWHYLARLLGLKYMPDPDSTDPTRQRLLGNYKGYLTVVQLSVEKERYSAGVGVLLRYPTVADVSTMQAEIRSDPVVDRLLGKEKTWRCTVEHNSAFCVFPYQPRKVTAEQLAGQISEWVDVVARYTRFDRLDRCEGDNCPDRGAPIQLVMINGFPMLLCARCRTQVPDWGDTLQQVYQAAPGGLQKGLVAGFGVAVLGALAWAVVAVVFHTLAAVLSWIVFIGTVTLMDRTGVKRTGWSLVLAGLLTESSAVLGAYLALVWDTASELPQGFMLSSLPVIMSTAWQALGDGTLLRQTIGFSLMGIIPVLLLTWREQRRHYSRMFRPEVEIVGVTWF